MGAVLLKAESFTIDGEAVVIGPNGLTDFEALRRRGAGEVAMALRARSASGRPRVDLRRRGMHQPRN
jgi:ATP-dependent DNA ligase